MKTKIRLARSAAVLGIGACMLTLPSLAQDCPELVGRWPYGPTVAVAVAGDYAYYGSGTALMVADVSDAALPQVVGGVVLPRMISDVAVSGIYAYVVDDENGLRVIDVSTPSSPSEVGSVSTPVGGAYGVAVGGGYAYVANQSKGLRVVDVDPPSSPAEVGFIDAPDNSLDVEVSGGYAYVAQYNDGIRVLDVSTPSAPAASPDRASASPSFRLNAAIALS